MILAVAAVPGVGVGSRKRLKGPEIGVSWGPVCRAGAPQPCQAGTRANIRLMFQTMVTKLHSPIDAALRRPFAICPRRERPHRRRRQSGQEEQTQILDRRSARRRCRGLACRRARGAGELVVALVELAERKSRRERSGAREAWSRRVSRGRGCAGSLCESPREVAQSARCARIGRQVHIPTSLAPLRATRELSLMLASLVRPNARPPGLRQIVADFGPEYVAHGFIGWLFAATAPVAIILAVGSRGGLLD